MYSEAMDRERGLLVVIFSGKVNTEADYERYLASIKEMQRARAGDQDGVRERLRGRFVLILIVDEGNPAPTAAQRKRIAEETANIGAEASFAVVTSSMLIRGVVTAINWLRPPKYGVLVTGSFSEAVQWAERRRGEPLPALHELQTRARADTTSAARGQVAR
jgi:hypothetical protein